MISWDHYAESACMIKVPRPMRGMIAPVFNFVIIWIVMMISFHVLLLYVLEG